MPSPSQLVAAACFLLALAATAWAFMADIEVADPGKPRIKGEPVQRLEAALPSIGAFEIFDVNRENPFVPLQQRKIERNVTPTKPTATKTAPTPVVPPAPVLPKIEAGPSTVPTCLGILTAKGETTVLTIPPGSDVARWVAVGQSVGGWTLTAVQDGSTTVWTDNATEQTLRLQVTPGENTGTEDETPKPKDGKKDPKKAGDKAQDPKTKDGKKDGKDAKTAKDAKAKGKDTKKAGKDTKPPTGPDEVDPQVIRPTKAVTPPPKPHPEAP